MSNCVIVSHALRRRRTATPITFAGWLLMF
jgi:hypothetical protein